MKNVISSFFILIALSAAGQLNAEYSTLATQAFEFYTKKEYKKSAETYSRAFQSLGWKGLPNDRYNAACSWALAGNKDSAFFQLFRIAEKSNYTNYNHISSDADLVSLRTDSRWAKLLQIVKSNKERAEVNLNKPLAARLDSVLTEDQKYRLQLDSVRTKYGWESPEMKNLWKIIREKDSLNLILVTGILDKYGWLGTDVVGSSGNTTLFLVIQHSDQATQEKHLPMMRDAVKNGKASAGSLALLEDRVALGQGRKQIYGSQIGMDPGSKTYYVQALDDPDNVDERRQKVGLGPLAEYVKRWNIIWNVDEYKKQLPELEKKLGKDKK